jgi:hypothetical protein
MRMDGPGHVLRTGAHLNCDRCLARQFRYQGPHEVDSHDRVLTTVHNEPGNAIRGAEGGRVTLFVREDIVRRTRHNLGFQARDRLGVDDAAERVGRENIDVLIVNVVRRDG